MTPDEFIAKWRVVELKERSASQSHFNDLCRLLGVEDPTSADGKGDWFTFERGAGKVGGGEGWADVWRKDCFAWEYKGKRKDLNAAYAQLQQYKGSLENPPLLIVSDMDRIIIRTDWTGFVSEKHEIALEDLRDAAKRDLLRACFNNPDRFKPDKTRQRLTEEAAEKFAAIAERLRKRGHDGHAVAHFINRLVFCMFAEDVDLLPDGYFAGMINRCTGRNAHLFAQHAKTLFAAMRTGGHVGFDKIDWFNGGLFDTDEALDLTYQDIDDLVRASTLDWSDIDPSIMGTLFERGLDPDKRSQLGAHYTDREKIMMIVTPVIDAPLRAEWAGILGKIDALLAAGARNAREKAEALHAGFVDRLVAFRILDPACGSGNFLSIALQVLKQIEHQANLDAFDRGLTRQVMRTGPENMLGIELNPYAAELARVSVWIGDIQWSRRNGFEPARNPILRSLNTIENRDAVLNADGTRAEWPKADVVVGNPPFLGDKKMVGELGAPYTLSLRRAWDTVPGGADLVCYWFAKAWEQMQAGKLARAGLVSTNSIRGGANREVLKPIVEGGQIFNAWADEAWTVEGAAVRVSMICFERTKDGSKRLNGAFASEIYSDLTTSIGGADLTLAVLCPENTGVAMQGPTKGGKFDIDGDLARSWLLQPINPNGRPNSDVLKPWANGDAITARYSDKWIIDFGIMPYESASLYEMPFSYVEKEVRVKKQQSSRQRRRDFWWQYNEPAPGLRAAINRLNRFLVTPEVSKFRLFKWMDGTWSPDKNLVVILRNDDTSFGILQSSFHEFWALRLGTSLEDRPRYTSSTTFRTFPFPEGLTPDIPASDYADDPRAIAIAAAAARLNELRENWLNPADLVRRVPEVVAGYPDRLLPVDDKAAAVLKARTLTNLYNQRPAWLTHAHRALDQAVAEAYGWGADWAKGMSEDEILARLFRLNQARAAGQGKAGKEAAGKETGRESGKESV